MCNSLKALDSTQQSAITRLFSAAVVRELASKGKSPLFSRLLIESRLVDSLHSSDSVSSVFDTAFSFIKKKIYRTEYTYKAAITSKLMLGRHSLNTAAMLTEFRVETCKVDIAIFNGTSTAYEIKSERDRLDRLENQLESYRKLFAKVYVVTGENHAEEVLKSTSDETGVLLLSDRFSISTIREAIERPDRVSPETICNSLQARECIQVLAEFGISAPNVPNTEVRRALLDIFRELDPASVHQSMVKVVRQSRSSSSLSSFIAAMPSSLAAAVFSVPIKERDHPKLIGAINTPIREALAWA
ncbi:TPA: sce7726 family protein [Pseudomonas aeruginosa]|uniref:sce7726 family protein n=1 Tax=Pseudomonas TaxID=286 RepID=UPI000CF5E83A|nr:sce7726 family protein [Pseudomonas aeruginosa]MBI7367345.1 sce7726 family protein [Pseudomonas aeruginosa]NPS71895.1 sce7726 family protein [Pseudomonas aeruginosa]PQM07500.1 hypothetical protein C5F85_30280 [Pseudomonas aeruginosa]TEE70863.1 hypothetical protein IPC1499_00030 [Pseudomonas aeruginosa]HEJ1395046.1 sce7726 family protein [Pseudomonas aeruginosa]